MQAIAEGINAKEYVQKILQDQGNFLRKECWHFDLALNHILKCVDKELGPYLASPNAKISGKLLLNDVNQAQLCGLSVKAIEHVFEEIGKTAGINNIIDHMTEFDIGRLLQV